jgi:hypothetical protein
VIAQARRHAAVAKKEMADRYSANVLPQRPDRVRQIGVVMGPTSAPAFCSLDVIRSWALSLIE